MLSQVDQVIKELKTTRSAFIRDSLQDYLKKLRLKQMEKKHEDGYRKYPVKDGEFDIWEDEQVWS